MDMDEFSQIVINEVHEKWRSLEQYKYTSYRIWECGFSVLYSPLKVNANLLILGFNPGGCEKDFSEAESSKPPSVHDYFRKDQNPYPLARKMRDLFKDKLDVLEMSVKANLIPFRCQGKKAWFEIAPGLRQDLENFSLDVVDRLVNVVTPKVILTEGTQTFDLFRRYFKNRIRSVSEPIVGSRNRRIYCRAEMTSGIKIAGILHLSGAWPTSEDIEVIRAEINKDL